MKEPDRAARILVTVPELRRALGIEGEIVRMEIESDKLESVLSIVVKGNDFPLCDKFSSLYRVRYARLWDWFKE